MSASDEIVLADQKLTGAPLIKWGQLMATTATIKDKTEALRIQTRDKQEAPERILLTTFCKRINSERMNLLMFLTPIKLRCFLSQALNRTRKYSGGDLSLQLKQNFYKHAKNGFAIRLMITHH